MKPTTVRHRMMYIAPLHYVSKQLAAPLSDELQEKYHQHSARVVEGDSVKVLRGEFKGIEGKVTHVSTERRGVAIEGIKREKLKGGNVDIYIHPSKVMITTLNLEDKWRQNRLEGQKPKTAKPAPAEPQKEVTKPKEQPKDAEKKEQKPKQKETKAAGKTEKTVSKSPKTKKSDK
ncbi:MAG TPA: 50S ribosomal protein L24 [Candidatus Nitrosotalea sp.]|nr:50S ribosomal protein L24 [Nitrososphaerota archaeon]HKU33643.1 50S ribosomal protein L24 [Candidatus Nitrosotalea sp.]